MSPFLKNRFFHWREREKIRFNQDLVPQEGERTSIFKIFSFSGGLVLIEILNLNNFQEIGRKLSKPMWLFPPVLLATAKDGVSDVEVVGNGH